MRTNLLQHCFVMGMACAFGKLVIQGQQFGTHITSQTPGQHDEADSERSSLIAQAKADPTDPVPLARLGLREARQGQYAQAIAFYRRAFALNPELPGLRLNLGLSLFKNGEYPEAIRLFTFLLPRAQAQPEIDRLTFLLGMSHYGLAEYPLAVPYLQQAAERDPRNLPLLLTLAHSCLLAKQYPCVVDVYHRMVAQDAASAEADMLVGEALDEMKDTTGAIDEFRAAVQANPKEPNVHFGLGYLLWTREQYEEAAQQFRAELANTPDHAQALVYLADASLKLNQEQEAASLLERVVRQYPKNALGHLDLGTVYQDRGQNEDALREFKTAAALAPDDVKTHMRLGRLYRSMNRTAEAKSEFLKARNLSEAARATVQSVMP